MTGTFLHRVEELKNVKQKLNSENSLTIEKFVKMEDLIRFGRFTGGAYNWAWKGNGSNGIAIPQHFDLYPIPSLSLSANPNLTQNSGY